MKWGLWSKSSLNKALGWLSLGTMVVLAATATIAQVRVGGPPFFGPGAPVAFNPEPAAVFSGHSIHGGVVVSGDRKYVHLNLGVTESRVSGVQTFPVYFAGGFVGSMGAWGREANGGGGSFGDPGVSGGSLNPPVMVSSSGPLAGVLAREGMTRLVRFD